MTKAELQALNLKLTKQRNNAEVGRDEALKALKGMLEWSDAAAHGVNFFKSKPLKAKLTAARAAIATAKGKP